jgi:Putative peptidoglycan binding domain
MPLLPVLLRTLVPLSPRPQGIIGHQPSAAPLIDPRGVSNRIWPGERIWLGGQWFYLAGILNPAVLAPNLDTAVLVGFPAAQHYLHFDGHPSTIYLRAQTDQVTAVQALLAATANPENPSQVTVSQPSDALVAQADAKTALNGLFLGLGAVGYLARPFGGHPRGGVADNGYPTSLVAVVRQSLSAQTSVSGTLGYAGSYTAVNQARGTVTGLPAAGRVVRQGRVLYEVNGQPVVLLYGSVPAYRSLAAGALASDVTGRDVRQLNRDLVALGCATRSQLNPSSDEFSSATKDAVKKLQAHLGVKQTGSLALGQAVFLPGAVRVTKVLAALGKPKSGYRIGG